MHGLFLLVCLYAFLVVALGRPVYCVPFWAGQVKVYHHSPEGVVTVKFRSPEAAQSCIRLMAGRFFGGRRLEAEPWDGIATWHAAKPAETPEEQAARLEAFARELEAAEEAKTEAARNKL